MNNKELEEKLFDLYLLAQDEKNLMMMFKILSFIYNIKNKNKKMPSINQMSDDDLKYLINILKDQI